MDLQLGKKTGVVTGASSGIGRAIAKGLAAEGVHLAITGRRRENLHEVAKEIVAEGGATPSYHRSGCNGRGFGRGRCTKRT